MIYSNDLDFDSEVRIKIKPGFTYGHTRRYHLNQAPFYKHTDACLGQPYSSLQSCKVCLHSHLLKSKMHSMIKI